jgi:putative transposase
MSLAALIAAQRSEHGIPHAVACRALGVSQAWFYKWWRAAVGGDTSPRRARRQALWALVAFLFHKHRGLYGSPRITAELRAMGWRVSPNTVAAAMAEQGLVARPKRRRRGTTKADRSARKAPDLVKRGFDPPPRPDAIWVGDLTELPNDQGRFYLAAVLDLHSRRCVGFAMGARHDAALAKAALQVAIAVRGGTVAGVVMHTDQGGEYTGELFKAACAAAGITQSMGRTGSALDNAVAEAFNSTLQVELLARSHFTTRERARRAVAGWIDDYNTTRRHSRARIDGQMMSPVAYELAHQQAYRQEQAVRPAIERADEHAAYPATSPATEVA